MRYINRLFTYLLIYSICGCVVEIFLHRTVIHVSYVTEVCGYTYTVLLPEVTVDSAIL